MLLPAMFFLTPQRRPRFPEPSPEEVEVRRLILGRARGLAPGVPPETERALYELMRRRIGEATEEAIRREREEMARRGLYATGIALGAERLIRERGQRRLEEMMGEMAYQEAIRRRQEQIAAQQAYLGTMERERMARLQLELAKYEEEMRKRQALAEMWGQVAGMALFLLTKGAAPTPVG